MSIFIEHRGKKHVCCHQDSPQMVTHRYNNVNQNLELALAEARQPTVTHLRDSQCCGFKPALLGLLRLRNVHPCGGRAPSAVWGNARPGSRTRPALPTGRYPLTGTQPCRCRPRPSRPPPLPPAPSSPHSHRRLLPGARPAHPVPPVRSWQTAWPPPASKPTSGPAAKPFRRGAAEAAEAGGEHTRRRTRKCPCGGAGAAVAACAGLPRPGRPGEGGGWAGGAEPGRRLEGQVKGSSERAWGSGRQVWGVSRRYGRGVPGFVGVPGRGCGGDGGGKRSPQGGGGGCWKEWGVGAGGWRALMSLQLGFWRRLVCLEWRVARSWRFCHVHGTRGVRSVRNV